MLEGVTRRGLQEAVATGTLVRADVMHRPEYVLGQVREYLMGWRSAA